MNHDFMRDNARDETDTRRLAISLGLFSIGLGAAELIAPRAMARLIGMREDSRNVSLLRAFGAREIGSGIVILLRPDKPASLWSRVAGDAVDLAVLGSAARQQGADPNRAAMAAAAVAGVTLLDVLCAQRLGHEQSPMTGGRPHEVAVEETITINKPIEEVYAFWRDFSNHPRFMRHLESVEVLDDRRSRWRAKGPGNIPVQWDAEIVSEREQELIAWRSTPDATLRNHGTVQFRRAPGVRGTEIRVRIEYLPPGGSFGRTLGWLFGRNPEQQLQEDLRRFKQLIETGEIAVSDGPSMWRAAQPSGDPDRTRAGAGVQP
jgi:uncharacterized membrane protein